MGGVRRDTVCRIMPLLRHGLLTLGLCLSTALSPALIHGDTYPRQPGVDAQHYRFRLTLLTDQSNEIQGEAAVTLALSRDDVREVFLDLATRTADGKGMTVQTVTAAGRDVAFSHVNHRLRLPVPAGVTSGQLVTFTIGYRGVPANGLRLINNIHGERTAFSENWYNRARQWLPMIDHVADKATGEFIITTRAEYQVVANGALVEVADLPAALRRTHWREGTPISSWLFCVGIARFIVQHDEPVRGVPTSYWAFPQDAQIGLAALSRDARGSFEFFLDHVGPYPYEKLAHVQAAGMGGGTEHASSIFYGEKGVAAGNAPVVHEIAHQWFGNAVTEADWNDVWLSEGFATYFTLLYTEHARGRDAFAEGLRQSRQTVLRLEQSLPNTPVIHVNLDDATTSPNNGLVYQKGAWILHMLRDQIGVDAFWKGIRLYYQRHYNGTAMTADLRRAMEQVSGQQLEWFFDQWLRRSGVPVIAHEWRYDNAAKEIVITVRQTQPGEPYRLSVDVGLSPPTGSAQIVTVDMTGREATVRVAADAAPARLSVDPQVWLLADIRP